MGYKLNIIVFMAALLCLVSGAINLDWMLVTYKFDMWNGSQGFWEFCPGFTMPWYSAYIWTVARLTVGISVLSFWLGRWRNG